MRSGIASLPHCLNHNPSVFGADDRNRTGDLVLTKDALCQLSYIGPPSLRSAELRRVNPLTSAVRERRRTRHLGAQPPRATWLARLRSRRERSLERETGIEPATNSLEGCDSTTELLPPSLPLASLATSAGRPAVMCLADAASLSSQLQGPRDGPRPAGLPAEAASAASVPRRLVAREGFEPSKPLGRQIYSLLRLTASLPRRFWQTSN